MTPSEPASEVEAERRVTNSKVARVIDAYSLDGFGDRLAALWTGADGDQRSLRELADLFNQAVLRAAMEAGGATPLDGEVENTYRLLTADDVSSGMRTQANKRLERFGVDVTELRADFVSHQAIHTYLTKYRGVSHDPDSSGSDEDPVEAAVQKIGALRQRTAMVTTDTLERLANADTLAADGLSVMVDVEVLCERCGTSYDVQEFVDAGGCSCAK